MLKMCFLNKVHNNGTKAERKQRNWVSNKGKGVSKKQSTQKCVCVTISDNMFKIENVVRFMVGTAL